ncbi:MAG: GlcNAc-PI de-N-acetylase [Actinomycetia bacterium]|nr:GlcNAc-PI de-N-acetylase [Actinomycetes bacterium]
MDGEASQRRTLLCLHAHPDDEAMLTGQLLAKAGAAGLRTIVVYGTSGEAGEARDELGTDTLGQRRGREAVAACAELGVGRVEFLPYLDSGMADTPTNSHPTAFCNADAHAVANEVADLVAGEDLLAIVGYDANGTYGHPDHLQVYAVAQSLARRITVPWVLDATYHREYLAGLPDSDGRLDPTFGSSEAEVTHFVQGEAWFRAKMEAIKQHNSQERRAGSGRPRRGIDGWRTRHGTEWFIAHSPVGASGLGPLAEVLEHKADWPGPPTRP